MIKLNEKEAINLLEETFSCDFNMEQFLTFNKELFNHFNEKKKKDNLNIGNEYVDYIESMKSLGTYRDKRNNDIIEVFTAKLKHANSMTRARTMQRNLIAKYLRKFKRKGALVAFYGENNDWRLSFVKMEYQLFKDDNGNLKVEEELTPAKRYSFLVGPNEPNYTCKRQFLDLIKRENVDPSLEEIENVFSIENVTKEFFYKYQELFLNLKESLEDVIKNDVNVQVEFDEKLISPSDFAKKLMGQIVFIYFLQKKGWLGVEKGAEWGTGPKNFLRKLFNGEIVKYNNFFNDLLEPLFYEALASERDDNYYRLFDCKIPFLNGGLFEPINGYNWIKTDLTLENSVFEDIFNTFDTFNFTVKEDEPLEKEVAVDPEMLGKVFENLLEVKDRKYKGAFYTPREIVHYMCQQSLINYLETNSDVPREDLETFIQLGDIALDSLIKEQEDLKKYNRSYQKTLLPNSIKENYEELDEFLKEIKVVDPAVGSGAFPVGMMNEIMRARSILAVFSRTGSGTYDLKREIIENCLYGVDIESSAVDITKLRFWLSLIVDETDIQNIKPLPNLDHKIMCGNSLLEEFEGIKLFDEKLFGTPKGPSPKIESIENVINSLKAELQIIRDDNAQIIRAEEIDAELKKLRRKRKRLIASEDDENNQAGLYEDKLGKRLRKIKSLQKEFFNERGSQCKKELRNKIETMEWGLIEETLKEDGNEAAMEKLDNYKKNNSKPFFLWKLYFAEVFQKGDPGFDIVIANPPYVSAVIHSKNSNKERERYRDIYPELCGAFDLYSVFLLKGLNLINSKGSYAWIIPNKFLVADYAEKILEKMRNKGLYATIDVSKYNVFHDVGVYPIILLGNTCFNTYNNYSINELKDLETNNIVIQKDLFEFKTFKDFGILVGSGTTGFQAKEIKPLINDYKDRSSTSIPFAVSGSIDPYLINTKKVRYMKSYYEHPHITYDPSIISKNKWNFWNKEKIVVAGMTKRIEAYYVTEPLALGVGCYAIYDYGNFNPKFLLGLLNSKFLSTYLKIKFKDKHLAGGYLAINKSTIEKLPLVDVNTEDQTYLVKLVDQIMQITQEKDYLSNPKNQSIVNELKKQIDELIYELYELTPKEIKIVKEFNI